MISSASPGLFILGIVEAAFFLMVRFEKFPSTYFLTFLIPPFIEK